jgi:hypothetical protein
MIENLIGLFDNELNNIETENDINLMSISVLVYVLVLIVFKINWVST